MRDDPEGVVRFEAGGERYSAVFGFRGMKLVERRFDKGFFAALQEAMPQLDPADMDDPEKVRAAAAGLRMENVASLFEAALAKHHPDLGEEEVEELLDELGMTRVGEILGGAVAAAIAKAAEGGDDSSPPHPRKRPTRKH